MPMTLTPQAAMGVVHTASECGDHPCEVPFKVEDIEKVFYCENGCHCGTASEGKTCGSWCDTWGTAVFRLKDGRYVYANESADSSGHG